MNLTYLLIRIHKKNNNINRYLFSSSRKYKLNPISEKAKIYIEDHDSKNDENKKIKVFLFQ